MSGKCGLSRWISNNRCLLRNFSMHRHVVIAAVALAVCLFPGPMCQCKLAAQASVSTGEQPFTASVGFDGNFKLGAWAPVFFQCDDSFEPEAFAITAVDGNGVPVTCRGPAISTGTGQYQGWVKIGRMLGSINFELFDGAHRSLGTVEQPFGGGTELIPTKATVPLVLTIESGSVIRDTVKSIEQQLFEEPCQAVCLNSGRQLPVRWQSYLGIRILYLATSDQELIQTINEQQFAAIEQWVRMGGKLVFCAGANSESAFSRSSSLARLLPGKFAGTAEMKSSSRIEWYASSKQPLRLGDNAPIVAARIIETDGCILEPADSSTPIVIRRPLGFGQVIFSTVDFDTTPIAEWGGRSNLLLKATLMNLNLNRLAVTQSESRGVVRVGYSDLIGQLMLPLENFSRVQFVNFTVVALLIALFLICIGPGDYFLLRRVIGKMEWTWITFSLLALAFCGLAVAIARSTKPAEMQINQLEIIDLDAVSKFARGGVWTNIYSPSNSRCDVAPVPENGLGMDTGNCNVSWLGLPGEGLAAMQSNTGVSASLQGYECLTESDAPATGFRSRLSRVPLRVSTTKTLFSQYHAGIDFDIRSRLRLNVARNRLSGTVTNPFDVDMQNCRLLFENWVYVLDRPLRAGETIDVDSELKERTTTFYFSRRVDSESDRDGGLQWNPHDQDLDRIAEMLMFHEIARGKRYTGMTHGYQSFVELSEHVNLNRAVLFGNVAGGGTELRIDSDSGPVAYDNRSTWVRIVLPVERRSSN